MSLVDMLKDKTSEYTNEDPKWVRFIKDHRNELIANATRRQFSDDYMNIIRYDLRRYLRMIQYPEGLDWIVFYINNIENEADFIRINTLLLPNQNQISDLKNIFLSQQ